MPFTIHPFKIDLLSPPYMSLIYVPYVIYLQAEYLIPHQFHFDFGGFLYSQCQNITLLLKSEYFLISESTDLMLTDLQNSAENLPSDEKTPQGKNYETTGKLPETEKIHQRQQKSVSCPCLTQRITTGVKKNISEANMGKKTFINTKKSNGELFLLLNSITVNSDEAVKQKILKFIEKENKCFEIVDSLIRRCLHSCTENEIRNLNKINKFLCQKSKDKFAVSFYDKVSSLLDCDKPQEKNPIHCKNLIVFLRELISEKMLTKLKINKIIMKLILKMVELLFEKESSENDQRMKETAKFLVILIEAGFKRAVNEEIVGRSGRELMRKLKDFQRNPEFLERSSQSKDQVSQGFVTLIFSQFSQLLDS